MEEDKKYFPDFREQWLPLLFSPIINVLPQLTILQFSGGYKTFKTFSKCRYFTEERRKKKYDFGVALN